MIIDKEFHALIPALSPEEYNLLESNVLADGIREPLILWQGVIVDGHNRYEIAQKHGLEFQTVERKFSGRNAVIEWMILNQLGRRNLSNYQRSLLAIRMKPIFEKRAEMNLHLSPGQGVKGCQNSDKVNIDTKKELAKLADVSHDTIARVQKIEDKATPLLKNKLIAGTISIDKAYQEVRKIEKIQAVERNIDEQSGKPSESIDIFSTQKKYSIIYADPAWTYGKWENGLRNPSLHYPVMTTDSIAALPIPEIAADNCILFIWVTYPLLPEALEVIKAWGFTYKTVGFVWVKKNKNSDSNFFGLGNWTRANSEICIIGIKGKIDRLDASISQVIESPIEGHSKKPDIVRSLITKLVGDLPKIELFSRTKTDRWDCWGNEL